MSRPSSVAYPSRAPQVDTNQDRLVTLEEFLASTQRKDFGDTGEGWEVRTRVPSVSLPARGPPRWWLLPHTAPLTSALPGLHAPPARWSLESLLTPLPCARRRWRCTLPTRRRS